jgi:PleD family two-component response regulator
MLPFADAVKARLEQSGGRRAEKDILFDSETLSRYYKKFLPGLSGSGVSPIFDSVEREEFSHGQNQILVLIVDDDSDMREYIRVALQSCFNLKTIEAADGSEGIFSAKEFDHGRN